MKTDLVVGLMVFGWVMAVTPGPNNIMLLASGLNFGVRRTLAHLAGVSVGFAFMVLVIGLGVSAVFIRVPVLYTVLKFAGTAYLLWLAWKIATAGAIEADATPNAQSARGANAQSAKGSGQPLSFLEASLFQWVNPKGWVLAIGATTSYAAIASFPLNIALMAAYFAAIGWIASGVWVVFGAALQRVLTSPRAVRIFNVSMALALVASLWPVVADLL